MLAKNIVDKTLPTNDLELKERALDILLLSKDVRQSFQSNLKLFIKEKKNEGEKTVNWTERFFSEQNSRNGSGINTTK